MRGALYCLLLNKGRVGIIPAYAGSTWHTAYIPKPPEDHPRVCGEHLCTKKSLRVMTGSSPRMRGALPSSLGLAELSGIIPAYAGSTSGSSSATICAGDHPRVCGEHESRRLLI